MIIEYYVVIVKAFCKCLTYFETSLTYEEYCLLFMRLTLELEEELLNRFLETQFA